MKENLLKIHKLLVVIPALAHLLFIPQHNTALYRLFTTLCAPTMFMFILVGLACLFNATRTNKDTNTKQFVISIVCLVAVLAFGGLLCYYYVDGLNNPQVTDGAPIVIALIISISLMASYALGLASLIALKFTGLMKK